MTELLEFKVASCFYRSQRNSAEVAHPAKRCTPFMLGLSLSNTFSRDRQNTPLFYNEYSSAVNRNNPCDALGVPALNFAN
jgi:hypothetical protein